MEILRPKYEKFSFIGTDAILNKHVIYRFPNRYGASLIQEQFHVEIALLYFPEEEEEFNYIIVGDEPILIENEKQIDQYLENIKVNKIIKQIKKTHLRF